MNYHDDDAGEMVSVRAELKRAYLQLSWGRFDEALRSCDHAAKRAPDHCSARTLRAAILSARGEHEDAIRELRAVRREHPGEALPAIFMAEALLLSGRVVQGLRLLDVAVKVAETAQEEELASSLRSFWSEVDVDAIPPPLRPGL